MTAPAHADMAPVARPRPARQQGVALCTQMLLGGMVGANLCLVAGVGLGMALSGPTGAVNAALAGAVVLVFFATGQGVQLIATQLADGTGMVVLLTSFLLRATVLGALLWFAMRNAARLEPLMRREALMAGALLATAGWVLGVLVTGSRQRVYAYDREYDAAHRGGERV